MTDEVITTDTGCQTQQEEPSQELFERLKKQLSEIAELHKKNTALYQKVGVLEQELLEKETMLSSLQSDKLQLEADCEKKDDVILKLRVNVENMEAENVRLSSELNACVSNEQLLEKKISQMENSKSWKITKPARMILRRLK